MTRPDTTTLAPFFSIKKKRPMQMLYTVTWPCGSTWEFTKDELDVPEYKNGEQTGVTFCFESLIDAKRQLMAEGCQVTARKVPA